MFLKHGAIGRQSAFQAESIKQGFLNETEVELLFGDPFCLQSQATPQLGVVHCRNGCISKYVAPQNGGLSVGFCSKVPRKTSRTPFKAPLSCPGQLPRRRVTVGAPHQVLADGGGHGGRFQAHGVPPQAWNLALAKLAVATRALDSHAVWA